MAKSVTAAAASNEKVRKKKEGQFSLVMKRLSKNKIAMAGLVIILLLFLVAIISPWIMPYAYEEMNMAERFATCLLYTSDAADE